MALEGPRAATTIHRFHVQMTNMIRPRRVFFVCTYLLLETMHATWKVKERAQYWHLHLQGWCCLYDRTSPHRLYGLPQPDTMTQCPHI
jgi:hypothetical protein